MDPPSVPPVPPPSSSTLATGGAEGGAEVSALSLMPPLPVPSPPSTSPSLTQDAAVSHSSNALDETRTVTAAPARGTAATKARGKPSESSSTSVEPEHSLDDQVNLLFQQETRGILMIDPRE